MAKWNNKTAEQWETCKKWREMCLMLIQCRVYEINGLAHLTGTQGDWKATVGFKYLSLKLCWVALLHFPLWQWWSHMLKSHKWKCLRVCQICKCAFTISSRSKRKPVRVHVLCQVQFIDKYAAKCLWLILLASQLKCRDGYNWLSTPRTLLKHYVVLCMGYKIAHLIKNASLLTVLVS